MQRILRALIALLLAAIAAPAKSTVLSDLWWNPNESGWGVNIIQQSDILFLTLFVYGTDGRPTWYVGPATAATSGSTFSGPLFATTGPWFGSQFNPSAVVPRPVGSVTVTLTSPSSANLSYTVDGITVNKAIVREFWKHIGMSGTFYGAMYTHGSTTCPTSGPRFVFYTIVTTATVASSGQTGSLTMTMTDIGGASLQLAGSYVQHGSIFDVNGTLTFGGTTVNMRIRDFSIEDDSISGNISAAGVNGCALNLRFGAVRGG